MGQDYHSLEKEQDLDIRQRLANWFLTKQSGVAAEPDEPRTSYHARMFVDEVMEFMEELIDEDNDDLDFGEDDDDEEQF